MLVLVLPLLFACDEQNENDLDDSPSVGFVSIGKFVLSNLSTSQTENVFVPSEDVDVMVRASDNSGVERVTLFLNGTQVASISNAPYNFEVDFPNAGEATLEVEAVDDDGNKSARVSQKVMVDNQKPSLNVELFVNSNLVDTSQSPLPPVDLDDSVIIRATPNDESSGIADTAVELMIQGVVVTNPNNLGQQTYQLNQIVDFNRINVIDISLKAIDAAGNESDPLSFSLTVKDRQDGPDLELPTVSLDTDGIEPGPIKSSSCTLPACFEGTISIPARVEDETGTARVTLIVESEALGKSPIATVTSFPYVFTLNTSEYPNNDKLTLTAQVVSDAGQGNDSSPVSIEVFNELQIPFLSINSPSSGEEVSDVVTVGVSVNGLADSLYTLDIDGDGKVNNQEGFFIEIVDFTGATVAEEYLNELAVPKPVAAEISGSYETPEGFDTTKLANDNYILKVSLPVRLKSNVAATPLVLKRSIGVSTGNDNKVPPSLLILSPTNPNTDNNPQGDVLTIRDPENAFVIVQATDNTGLEFIEMRLFTGETDGDATPSRYVHSVAGLVGEIAALPINYNANTSDNTLPNGNDYTIRIVAQDIDSNRTFQDVTVNLQRKRGEDAPYTLTQISPGSQVCDSNTPPNCRFVVQNIVAPNIPFSFEVSPVNGDEKFDYFYLAPSASVHKPLVGTTGLESPTVGTAFVEEGLYSFIAQVTQPDGSIYITNSAAISIKK